MNSAFKLMNSAFKMMNSAFKMMNSAFKLMNSAFCIQNDEFSHQIHYDWGLRALKPVLSFGGSLITAKRKEGPVSPADEEQLIIQSLRVNTLSKLTFEDSERFQALIADVFPNDKKEDVDYPEFESAIREVLAEDGLQCMDKQLAKILQLHEATRQRMGVTIVGPSGEFDIKLNNDEFCIKNVELCIINDQILNFK